MRISNRCRELIFSVRPLVQSITCPWRNTHAMQLAGDALFPFPLPLTHPVSLTLSPLSFSGREREAERPGDAGALSKTGSLELHSHYAAIHEICQPFGFRAVGVSHNFFQNSPHVVPSRHVVLAISRIVAASPFPSSWLRKYAKWMEFEEWTSFLIMSLSQCAQMIFIRWIVSIVEVWSSGTILSIRIDRFNRCSWEKFALFSGLLHIVQTYTSYVNFNEFNDFISLECCVSIETRRRNWNRF